MTRRTLLDAGHPVRYPAGHILMRSLQRTHEVYVVERGVVKVLLPDQGGHNVLVEMRGSGELAGELEAIENKPRSATVVAASAIQGRMIDGRDFIALLRKSPCLAEAVLQDTARRLLEVNLQSVEFHQDVSTRIVRVLVHWAELYGAVGNETITLAFSQQEIADGAGVSLASVENRLRILRRQGLISTNRRELTILDMPKLKWQTSLKNRP